MDRLNQINGSAQAVSLMCVALCGTAADGSLSARMHLGVGTNALLRLCFQSPSSSGRVRLKSGPAGSLGIEKVASYQSGSFKRLFCHPRLVISRDHSPSPLSWGLFGCHGIRVVDESVSCSMNTTTSDRHAVAGYATC